ncbi:hypothetical protein CONPUDRAFT_77976 [Coniophora puteana RWD-64-598 SS2]|uniref:Protein kinase domain-containing protein n=1 Tax=Coniophora puteana (strain RWD-64-598) TaxID=741705 RepID=R7SG61_CONPW|nr:uncharacterized protein CONPUDRAFT_77976 [Coniophora puteana RWD-64-598 SS2]EIW74712.1 hypothetical protein CONPUDRAFT_77976 [Coniophora puteana RWD-64-598 SS2]
MSTLQFPVDLLQLGDDDEFVTLDSNASVMPPFDSTPRRIAEIIGFISSGGNSYKISPENLHKPFVLRARLDNQRDGEDSVICKAGYGKSCSEKLKKEAQIYSGKLSSLQGICVPRIYGYYTGWTIDEGRLSVLVMEDCGQPLPRLLDELPRRVKESIVECLMKLHQAGIEHGDIDDGRNVVICPSQTDGYEVRIVGFGEADDNHSCEVNPEFLENSTNPGFERVGCYEIFAACVESQLWDKDHISFYDIKVPVDQLTSVENLLAVTNILNELEEHEDLREWEARGAAEAKIDSYRRWCEAREYWESLPLFT